jgi:lipoyl-dependent peroxiredoxin
MIHLGKVLYTAKTHTTGSREGGASRTSDGHLDVKLSAPGTTGSGTNRSNCSRLAGRPAS